MHLTISVLSSVQDVISDQRVHLPEFVGVSSSMLFRLWIPPALYADSSETGSEEKGEAAMPLGMMTSFGEFPKSGGKDLYCWPVPLVTTYPEAFFWLWVNAKLPNGDIPGLCPILTELGDIVLWLLYALRSGFDLLPLLCAPVKKRNCFKFDGLEQCKALSESWGFLQICINLLKRCALMPRKFCIVWH